MSEWSLAFTRKGTHWTETRKRIDAARRKVALTVFCVAALLWFVVGALR